MFWLSQWILKKQNEHFLQALMETKAQVDEVSDKQVQRVLRQMRWRRAIDPYLYIFKLAWEIVRGRYWKSSSQGNGGTHQASGGSAGAIGQPVTQFTYPGGLTVPAGGAGPFSQGAGGVGTFSVQPPVGLAFEDAGIIAGEVTAYRCWKLGDDGLLYSVFQDEFCWKPGEVIEGIPTATNGEGVHAFKSILLMAQYGSLSYYLEGCVTGTVELWGEVYEHEKGYRASKAAIKTIDESPYYDVGVLRKLYGLELDAKPDAV